jgi:heat-inducible transcriptional repressor
VGTELQKFTPVFLQALVSRTGDMSQFLMPLLSSVFEIVEELQAKSVHVKGESNILKCFNNDFDARALLKMLTQQDKLFPLLANTNKDIEIVFGDQTDLEALQTSSLIIAKYRLGDKDIGRIGVVGPVRLAYEQLIPTVEYFAYKLGVVMTQAMRDLEE